MRILLVEDDHTLRRALATALRGHGHSVHAAPTGHAALDSVRSMHYDICLLDLGLPDIDGITLLPELRAHHHGPVIVLSARRDQSDKVAALDAGADDYMTKPFGLPELLARLRAHARRAGLDTTLTAATGLRIDLADRQVTDHAGHPIDLTPTEWAVLDVLARAGGSVVSTDDILAAVWGDADQHRGNVRAYVNLLRRKLETDPATPEVIVTQPSRGYRLMIEPATHASADQ